MLNWAEKNTMKMIADDVLTDAAFCGWLYKEVYLRGTEAMPNAPEDAILTWASNWAGI